MSDVSISMGLNGLASVSGGLNQAGTAANNAKSQMDAMARSSKSLEGALGTLKAGFAFFGGVQLAKGVVDTALAFDRLQRTLNVAAGGVEQGRKEFEFIRKKSDELGLSLQDVATGFARLSIAAKGTSLEGAQSRKIFTAIAEASTVMGLSADQSAGALRAVEQMISKGNVSAEELRGQLGERLPGAFQIMARAMGVTTVELNKLLDNGMVVAADVLPKFADELRKTFGSGLGDATKSAQANINRFQTAWAELQNEFAKSGFLDGLVKGMKDLAITMKDPKFISSIKAVGEAMGWFVSQTGWAIEQVSNAWKFYSATFKVASEGRIQDLGKELRAMKDMETLAAGMLNEKKHSQSKHGRRLVSTQIAEERAAKATSNAPKPPTKAELRAARQEEEDAIDARIENEERLIELQERLYGSAADMLKDIETPLTKYNEQLDLMGILLDGGYMSGQNYNKVLDDMNKKLAESNESVQAFERGFDTLFDAAIDGGEDFIDTLEDVGKTLAKDLLRSNVYDPLKDVGKSFVGSLLGGGKRAGGGMGGEEGQADPMAQVFDSFITKLGGVFGAGEDGVIGQLTTLFMGEEGILGSLGGIFSSAWEGLGAIFSWFIGEETALALWSTAESWAIAIWETAERWAIAIFEAAMSFIPGFERGGEMTVTRPTLIMVGEKNKAERLRVSPVSGGMSRNAARGGGGSPSGGGGGGDGGGVNVYLPATSVVNNMNAGTFARQIARTVRRENARLV